MTLPASSPIPPWDQGAASELGARREQQDRWGIFQSPDQQGLLAILADGMGGHLDGALGAQIVIDEARQFVQNPTAPLRCRPARRSRHLGRQMHDTINRQSETARSTVVMAWLAAATRPTGCTSATAGCTTSATVSA